MQRKHGGAVPRSQENRLENRRKKKKHQRGPRGSGRVLRLCSRATRSFLTVESRRRTRACNVKQTSCSFPFLRLFLRYYEIPRRNRTRPAAAISPNGQPDHKLFRDNAERKRHQVFARGVRKRNAVAETSPGKCLKQREFIVARACARASPPLPPK